MKQQQQMPLGKQGLELEERVPAAKKPLVVPVADSSSVAAAAEGGGGAEAPLDAAAAPLPSPLLAAAEPPVGGKGRQRGAEEMGIGKER